MKILFQGDFITEAFRRPEGLNPAYQLGNGHFFSSQRLSGRVPLGEDGNL